MINFLSVLKEAKDGGFNLKYETHSIFRKFSTYTEVMLSNRRICVLIFSGICSGKKDIQPGLEAIIRKLCKGYFDLYKQQSNSETLQNAQKDEFFGLRDFYRLEVKYYTHKFI